MATFSSSGGATSRRRSSPRTARVEQDRPPPALPGRDRQGRRQGRPARVQRLPRGVAQGPACLRRRPQGRGRRPKQPDWRPNTRRSHSCSRGSRRAASTAGRPAAGHNTGQLAAADGPRLTSATREVVIGSDRPFALIGERINPTGRTRWPQRCRPATSAASCPTPHPGGGRRPPARRQRRHPTCGRAGSSPRTIKLVQIALTFRSRSTRPSSKRWRPGSPSIRASPLSTRSPARRSASSACCRSSASTARRSSRSPTTTPASPRTPTSGSRSPGGSWSGPPTTASRARTSSSTRWSCRSGRCRGAGVPGVQASSRSRFPAELHVNTICGASEHQLWAAAPGRGRRPVPRPWPSAPNSLASAIANPLIANMQGEGHGRRRPHGQRPRCGRWIRDQPRTVGRRRVRPRRVNRRAVAVA